MQNISDLINREELQRLQDDLCRATGICVYCMDAEGQMLTDISGTSQQIARAREYAGHPQVIEALERVEEGFLEDQAVEDLENGDKVASIAVRIDGDTLVIWMAFSLVMEESEGSVHFNDIVDLLRSASSILLRYKLTSFSAQMESQRSRSAEQEMSKSLHAIEAADRIFLLMDSSEPATKLMDIWLKMLCEYLQVDTAQLYQNNKESNTMIVRSEWLAPGQMSAYDRTSNLSIPRMLRTEKFMVVSSDVTDEDMRAYLKELRLQALIQMPVIQRGNEGALMLSLNYRRRHIWSMEEIKFSSDSVRVLNSILDRRLKENTITNSYKSLEAVLDNVGCAIYVKDEKTGNMLFANRWLQSIFGKELEENTFEALLEDGISRGKESNIYEIHHTRRDKWYDLVQKEIAWMDGKQACLYSLYDITDKKLYQQKIEMQANTDFLTGLYNRMSCDRDLARYVDTAKKTGRKGALLYLDLDDFKHINDALGHQYGDVLLKAISHALQRILGIQDTCYHMGGDEFVIIVPPDQYDDFDRIVSDIQAVFARPWLLKETDYYCTMSMGSVTFPDMGDTVLDLVKKADIAMYEAKHGGKNRVVRYKESNRSGSGRRLDMEKSMRDATATGYDEFEVYYQPIINVADGDSCVGAEALIRWNSSKLGFIPPAEFIPLAEYLGLINPIGNYVLKEACSQCRKWNENGYPDYKVNVNLSIVQLLQADIVETVEHTLEETGLEPRNLTLEVKESLALSDMERLKTILNRIKDLGVKIALDDFGTGYSSLNHIREIPFNLVKVDQCFAKDLAKDAFSQSFIRMVAEMAGTMGLHVCVEGIETQEQFEMLKGMNVEYIQGFYFDRPMKQSDFEQKYVANRQESV